MKNIYQSKGLEEKDHDLSGQFLTTILSVFPNTVDFSRMNVYNWHHEQKEYQNWSEVNDSPNIVTNGLNCFLHSKESISKEVNFKMPIGGINSENVEGLRKEVQMKGVLRKIRRDIRKEFFLTTSFDVKRKSKRVESFSKSLDEFSILFFGEYPSKKHKLFLGSLISNKYMRLVLQNQRLSGELSQNDYDDLQKISKDVHATLYNYSETRLHKMSLNKHFQKILCIHYEKWNTRNKHR